MQAEIKEKGGSTLVKQKVIQESETPDPMGGFWNIRPDYSSGFEAYIPIQNGCDKFCTFCAVPYTRGREISRPSSEILQEVKDLVAQGYKSITLLGQNVNSYGLDRFGSEIGFPELMRQIGEIGKSTDNKFWVYFTSPHPRDMSNELIDVIADYDCLAKQIHLPIQSGDDKVLIKMNRNHSTARYREIVDYIRLKLPKATLFTDIIVGFSSEDETQFTNTKKAMEEFQYNMAYIAMYSPRPGAASSRWDDTVDQDEKKRRFQILTETLQKSSRKHNEAMIGKEYILLVDRPDRKKGYLSGKTEGRLIVRFPSEDQDLIGSFVRVKITDCANLSLEGELVDA
jgi:tRNA-2-methylthio-N6-dimethylallyladenosine synthase